MKCSVDGCEKEAMYKKDQICQMHYFRRMRNGNFDLLAKERKYRRQNPAGYQKVYEPDHQLANSDGYVYEHRFIYFNEINDSPDKCEMCGDTISWDDCHIDHIDNDVTNNKVNNLRALCRSCNVFRGHTTVSMGKIFLTIDGMTKTAFAWARHPDVKVSYATIVNRKRRGYSDYDAVYGERLTCQNTKTKKYSAKHDEKRGIIDVS